MLVLNGGLFDSLIIAFKIIMSYIPDLNNNNNNNNKKSY
jgi:hypothetical protein